jgi:hypothetical protein
MSEAKTFGRLKTIEPKLNVIPKLNYPGNPANLYQISNFLHLHLHLASVYLNSLLPGSRFDEGTKSAPQFPFGLTYNAD